MTHFLSSRFLIWFGVCFTLTVATDKEECKDKICPGPLAFYQRLNCTPVYGENDTCCAVKYNCTHLENKSSRKCHLNGHEYELTETVRYEDRNPCEDDCRCSREGRFAEFHCYTGGWCLTIQYPNETCYPDKSPLDCCGFKHVCVAKQEDLPTCQVDGNTYIAGMVFHPANRPDLYCVCREGFTGELVPPFCMKSNRPYDHDINTINYFLKHCPPSYSEGLDRLNGKGTWTCWGRFGLTVPVYKERKPAAKSNADTNGVAVHTHNETESDDDVCHYNNIKLHLHDELHMASDLSPTCVKCVCDVPPVPTCINTGKAHCNIPDSYWQQKGLTANSGTFTVT